MRNLVLVSWLMVGISVAQEMPKTMTKMEVILQSPDAPQGSFAAKPKVMYRAGARYCRVEEQPDPDKGIHGVLIIHEPDYWFVNLFSKTAQHGVDPGPTFNCQMPVFAEGELKSASDEDKQIKELEFGRELEFFKSRGAVSQPGPVLQTKQTTAYKLEFGDLILGLFTYGNPERPLALMRGRGDKNDIFWYSGYGQVDFDQKLFAKPENVKIEDSKPKPLDPNAPGTR